jgi:hypothetical protein
LNREARPEPTSCASQAAGVLGLRWRLFDFGRISAQIEQAKGPECVEQDWLLACRRLPTTITKEALNKSPDLR